jgi:hypothetical protein
MAESNAAATLEPALVKALAAQFYGLALDDARAARIAADLGTLEASLRAAGTIPISVAPGAMFRQLLLARDQTGVPRA